LTILPKISILAHSAIESIGGILNRHEIRKHAKKLLYPIVYLCVKLNVHPSVVTVAGLLITGLAAWQIWAGHYLIGVIVLFFGSILDAADGEIARRNNVCSKVGAILDSVCDRMGEALIYTALLAGELGQVRPVLVYLVPAALAGSFMVSYIRARAEGMGIECSIGIFTRVERLFLYITGIVASLVASEILGDTAGDTAIVIMLVIMSVGTWITAFQRFYTVHKKGINQPL